MYRLSRDTPLTVKLIEAFISRHKREVLPRMDKLIKAYLPSDEKSIYQDPASGRKDIKLFHPYAAYITDINVGYFVGDAIKYQAAEDDESAGRLLDRLGGIYSYTDEADVNTALAEYASILGIAYELLYMDADAKVRFTSLDPREVILIRDDSVDGDILYAIRLYTMKDMAMDTETEYAVVYDATTFTVYRRELRANSWTIDAPTAHNFSQVPINPYFNNHHQIGDFEPVMSLIQAYDRLEGNCVSEQEDFRNAYLTLEGMEDTDEDDIKGMKTNKILVYPQGGKAAWLVKPQDDAATEHLRTRIDKDIHKLSKTPALTDEDFSGNASGIALKYKLQGLENAASKKERGFRRGLQRRMELICELLKILDGVAYDYTTISMAFTRNVPNNLEELANVAEKLAGLISEETAISLLPIDIDPKAELQKKQAEARSGYGDLQVKQG
jgi:SPP1 family phage portal protein